MKKLKYYPKNKNKRKSKKKKIIQKGGFIGIASEILLTLLINKLVK